MALSSPSERSLERRNPLSAIPPLMGFECLPPVGIPPCVHSQEPRLPSDRRCHTPVHVPPSWFRATSMVSSATELRVCCTPQPTKGSPRFMHAACSRHPEATRTDGVNPRDAVHTLRRLPLISSRTHITVAVALLSLPSCPISHIRPRPDGSPTAARRGVRRTPIVPAPAAALPRPEGRASRRPGGSGAAPPKKPVSIPGESIHPKSPGSREMGGSTLRRLWGSLSRWGGVLGAPKNSGFPVPRGGVLGAPRSSGFPVP
jgi:hypothetical protein